MSLQLGRMCGRVAEARCESIPRPLSRKALEPGFASGSPSPVSVFIYSTGVKADPREDPVARRQNRQSELCNSLRIIIILILSVLTSCTGLCQRTC